MPMIFGNAAEAEKRFQLGIECFRTNRLEEAEAHFRAAASLAPRRPDAHNNLGVALSALGRTVEAAESLRRAISLKASNVESHVALGDIALRAGRPREAAEHYGNALAWQPQAESIHFALAKALSFAADPHGAADHLREAIRLKPDFADACCKLGLVLDQIGNLEEAKQMLRRAIELDPGNADFRLNLRILASRGVPMWHFSMVNDAARNAAYERAIKAAVRPGDLVLEIGTGSGLLAMMAARAGARHVVTCESAAPVAAKARQIIARNGYSGRIEVVALHSTQLRVPEELPEPADVLISEIVSSDLLGEGLLETYEDARRLLKPETKVVPSRAWVRGQLVAAEGLDAYVTAGKTCGFDLSDFNEFRPLRVHPSEADVDFTALSAPLDIFEFDLQASPYFPADRKRLMVPVRRAGLCAGILQWVRLQLAADTFYENSPQGAQGVRRAGHWQQVLHLFDDPIAVEEGQVAAIIAHHNRRNLLFRVEATETATR